MKKSKVLAGVIAGALSLSMSLTAFAQGKIFVDLQEVTTDTPPQIVNDRTMVPVRAITEMLGYDVNWLAEKQQVEICEKGNTTPVIIMNINNTKAYYTKYDSDLGDTVGYEEVLDSPATLINDRTFVPLRFISEAVGYTVDYNIDTADVYMFSPEYNENQQGEGKGGDEGMGEAVPLTEDEMTYLLEQTTESWLAMNQEEKSELVVLIGRWWEDYENIVQENYDEMVEVIDHQMEQYHKNNTDEGVFETACDIYEIDVTKYIKG